MNFKKWIKIQESGTSTASVAGFSRISIPMVRRTPVNSIATEFEEDPFFKKLRKDKKK